MGVCYSVQEDWQDDVVQVGASKRPRRRKKKQFSIIEEQKSQYESSFISIVQDQYRNSLYQTIHESDGKIGTSSLSTSVVMGSIVEMTIQEQHHLMKSLATLNLNNPLHTTEKVTLCNFKTKNFLHTHRVKLQKSHHFNQVSCCPYDVNHNIDYDTWVLNPSPSHGSDFFTIYHPFTKKYLQAIQDIVAAGDDEYIWQIQSLGPRRNQGFIRIKCEHGYLHMADSKALLKGHRTVDTTPQQYISNLWELAFVQ